MLCCGLRASVKSYEPKSLVDKICYRYDIWHNECVYDFNDSEYKSRSTEDLLPIIVNTCSVLKQLQIDMFGSLMS